MTAEVLVLACRPSRGHWSEGLDPEEEAYDRILEVGGCEPVGMDNTHANKDLEERHETSNCFNIYNCGLFGLVLGRQEGTGTYQRVGLVYFKIWNGGAGEEKLNLKGWEKTKYIV